METDEKWVVINSPFLLGRVLLLLSGVHIQIRRHQGVVGCGTTVLCTHVEVYQSSDLNWEGEGLQNGMSTSFHVRLS